MLPLGIFLSIFQLFLTKIITKYIILYRLAIPKKLGLDLSIEMIKMMEWVPLIYGISLFLCNKYNKKE